MTKLLKEGQTDLLAGFVSQRTHRPFKAYLALGKDGKVSFKFDETAGKASSARRKATSSASAKKTEICQKVFSHGCTSSNPRSPSLDELGALYDSFYTVPAK